MKSICTRIFVKRFTIRHMRIFLYEFRCDKLNYYSNLFAVRYSTILLRPRCFPYYISFVLIYVAKYLCCPKKLVRRLVTKTFGNGTRLKKRLRQLEGSPLCRSTCTSTMKCQIRTSYIAVPLTQILFNTRLRGKERKKERKTFIR